MGIQHPFEFFHECTKERKVKYIGTFSSYRSLIRAEPKPPSKGVDSRDKLFLSKNSFDFGRF